MKRGDRFKRKLIPGSAVYDPPLPGVPVLELMGDSRVLIENHNGVIAYGDACICVRVKNGKLTVTGDGLTLAYMSRCQLTIIGRILKITVERGT